MNREMKESHIDWIDKIPIDWSIKKIKNTCELLNGYAFNSELYVDEGIHIIRITNVNDGYLDLNDKKFYKYNLENKIRKYLLKSNNILISLTGNVGNVAEVKEENLPLLLNQRVAAITATNIQYKYFFYLINTNQFKEKCTLMSEGIAQLNLSTEKIKNFKIPIPKFNLQIKIVSFLDKKCSIIDKVIEENKKSIKQIEDYRKQSINTVTIKGIDKTKEMKDTGINWIGSIPFDWKVEKLKFNIKTRNDKVELNNNIYVGLENIENNTGKYIESNTEYENGIYDYFEKHDILFNKLRPYLTKCLYTSFNGCCTGELEIIEKFKGYKKYLFYFLISNRFIDIVNSSTYGTKMPRANWSFIKELPIILPSFEEQKQIAEHLDKKCLQTDKVISKRKELIEKLEEYKKSLIYEVVTGKIEI